MMLQENGGRSEWVGGVRAQMQQDAAWAASAATCSASATAECTYGANDFCSTSTWICRASWEWEPHPDMVDWIGGQMLALSHACMHAPNTMSLSTLNCSRPAASCSESDAALSSLGNREYTCLSNLYSKFSKVHVSAKHVGCSGGHAPPRKSLLPFWIELFRTRQLQANAAPSANPCWNVMMNADWMCTNIRTILRANFCCRWQLILHSYQTDNWVCGATEVEKSLVSFHWATLDALLIALRTYIPFLNFQQSAT